MFDPPADMLRAYDQVEATGVLAAVLREPGVLEPSRYCSLYSMWSNCRVTLLRLSSRWTRCQRYRPDRTRKRVPAASPPPLPPPRATDVLARCRPSPTAVAGPPDRLPRALHVVGNRGCRQPAARPTRRRLSRRASRIFRMTERGRDIGIFSSNVCCDLFERSLPLPAYFTQALRSASSPGVRKPGNGCSDWREIRTATSRR